MANYIRIKRRAQGAPGAGAPSSLQNAELAFNENDNVLYYGWGTGGAGGTATQVISIGGDGAYVTLGTGQTISGDKIFTGGITAASLSVTNFTVPDNSIALGTKTTGNYVDRIINSANITGGVATEAGSATLNLTSTGVVAGSYGSGTSIPTFTVDNYGRLTAASTASVATTLNLAGNTGTGSVNLINQSLTVAGGTHITATASNQTITITTDAATAATASTLVARDGSGNIIVNTVSGNSLIATGSNTNITLTPAGTGSVDVSSKRIINVATPIQSTDAANKNYVDLLIQGLDPKQSVRLATTAASGNIASLSGTSMTIDGIAVVAGDRVLIKDQASASANGIYVVAVGAWSRATDMDDWSEVPSAYVFVEAGLTNSDNGFLCTSDQGGTIGINDITWVQFNGAGQVIAGAGLTKTGNTIDAVGTTGRITVNPNSIDIASDYIGQNTIQYLGTVTAGTWQGNTVAVGYGGTGVTTLAASGVLYGNTQGAIQATAAGTYASDGSQILSVGSDGKPAWTWTIDGGSF